MSLGPSLLSDFVDCARLSAAIRDLIDPPSVCKQYEGENEECDQQLPFHSALMIAAIVRA